MEMKRLIPTIMPACCLVLLFSACSEKSSYTQLIPGDASSVVAVNLQSLTEKSRHFFRNSRLRILTEGFLIG